MRFRFISAIQPSVRLSCLYFDGSIRTCERIKLFPNLKLVLEMMSDVPCITYMALYILSFHILQSNSRTSTLWKLNAEEGKIVEASHFPRIVTLPGLNNDPYTTENDHIFDIITSTIHFGKSWTKQSMEYYCTDCQSINYSTNDK